MILSEEELKEIEKKAKEWESTTLKNVLEKVPESKQTFTTISGIPIKRIYTPTDIANMDYAEDLGFPGEFP